MFIQIKFTSDNPFQREIDIFFWCVEKTKLYWEGKLPQEIIDKLNSIGFDWNLYKNERSLDEM